MAHRPRTHDLLSARCQCKVYCVPLVLVSIITLHCHQRHDPTSNFDTLGQGGFKLNNLRTPFKII